MIVNVKNTMKAESCFVHRNFCCLQPYSIHITAAWDQNMLVIQESCKELYLFHLDKSKITF